MNSDITLRQLKIFSKIVEEGSFNRCAHALDVSSVAITKHVKKLEDHLGNKIFERHPGEVAVLTEYGTYAYKLVMQLLTGFDELLCESDNVGKYRRRLNIASDIFILDCMRGDIASFERAYPKLGIQYELEAVSYAEIKKQFSDNKIDIGYFYALEDYDDVESELVCHIPLAIYVSEKHPLAQKEIVSIDDLIKYPMIAASRHNSLNKLSCHMLEKAGLKNVSVDLQTDNVQLFIRTLQQKPVFACMFQWVEMFNLQESPPELKCLVLDWSQPSLQVRQAIRPPLQYDEFVVNAAYQLTQSIRNEVVS